MDFSNKELNMNTDQKLDAILNAIKGLEARVSLLEAGKAVQFDTDKKTVAHASPAKKTAIKEFLLKHPPTTDIQRTLAIGYFLENNAGMTSFNRPDLEKGYSDAKESPPSNIGVNIRHCIKQGHMMEADEKKDNKTVYTVTRSGEQFVAGGYKSSGGKKR
jgi:hypothetical protein